MATWIGLFRGVNVGGNSRLPMVQLKSELEALGFKNVRTYIQSGNVVFESPSKSISSLATKIRDRIAEQFGFRPHLLLLGRDDLLAAIAANPFPNAVAAPQSLHFFFLAEPPLQANAQALDAIKLPTEKFKITDRVFYLLAPDGIGRSKLAANAEKHLGVVTTARNYRTVDNLRSMVN